jgi:hypothetical protein
MARLLNDADLRIRLAAGALERVQRFTASAVAERLEDFYARVVPRNPETSSRTYRASAGGRDTDRS